MRLAQLQTPIFSDQNRTLDAVEQMLDTLPAVDFVTLPEMFCCPYETTAFPRYAEAEGGRVWETCSRWAREHQIYLSAGSLPERDSEGRIYNTAYVFDPQGKQIAKHRKMHLFDIQVAGGQQFRESETLSAGERLTVFDTAFGKMGLCICYDFRFPELSRLMALEGAVLLLVPAAFNRTTGPLHWELLFRSRAADNQLYTVGTAPACLPESSYQSYGHSIVADPWGRILQQADTDVTVQLTTLDLQEVERVREQLPLLKHRRPDCYTIQQKEREL